MERNKLSVSQLNNYIKGVFDDELILKNITVFGEVSEKSEAAGNLYMTLSDSGSILRCVRFGPGESPRIGETVLVTGSVNYYAKGNRVTFTGYPALRRGRIEAQVFIVEGKTALRRTF